MSQLQELQARYKALESREQNLLLVAAVVVSICLVYLILYKPLANSVEQLQKSHVSQTNLRDWMTLQVAQLKSSGAATGKTVTKSTKPLSSIINETALANQIQISRSQPRPDNQYQIWLDKVTFSQLVRWLDSMQSDHGIFVQTVNISRAENNDEVRVSLMFQGSL